jgi:hypothetical protein
MKIMSEMSFEMKTLLDNKYTICIFKNNVLVYASRERGILPLYKAYMDGMNFDGCSCADKIVGLGAAYFYSKFNVTKIDTKIISKSAYEYFKSSDIEMSYDILTDKILNRTSDGNCPVETIAKKSNNFKDFLRGTGVFLSEKGLL